MSYKRSFIDVDILKEIKGKVKRLNEMSWPSEIILKKFFRRSLEKESTLHSYKIENPDFPRSSHKKRDIKNGIKYLNDAFQWGSDNLDPEHFTDEYVMKLAGKTDPVFHQGKMAYYRQGNAVITAASWRPPRREEVPDEMEKYAQFLGVLLKEEHLCSQLEAAIYAHFHLARIHPFQDTNGRTARTLQNVILQRAGLPPPIIYAGERHDYYHHLDQAVWGWRERISTDSKGIADSPKENAFYDYMAGKVSASLDKIFDNIDYWRL